MTTMNGLRTMSLELTYRVGQPHIIPLSAHLQKKLVWSGHNVLLSTLQQELHHESFGTVTLCVHVMLGVHVMLCHCHFLLMSLCVHIAFCDLLCVTLKMSTFVADWCIMLCPP